MTSKDLLSVMVMSCGDWRKARSPSLRLEQCGAKDHGEDRSRGCCFTTTTRNEAEELGHAGVLTEGATLTLAVLQADSSPGTCGSQRPRTRG
ncbi:hypothetical protein AAY473_000402 [Plecturocebus cupreus]